MCGSVDRLPALIQCFALGLAFGSGTFILTNYLFPIDVHSKDGHVGFHQSSANPPPVTVQHASQDGCPEHPLNIFVIRYSTVLCRRGQQEARCMCHLAARRVRRCREADVQIRHRDEGARRADLQRLNGRERDVSRPHLQSDSRLPRCRHLRSGPIRKPSTKSQPHSRESKNHNPAERGSSHTSSG